MNQRIRLAAAALAATTLVATAAPAGAQEDQTFYIGTDAVVAQLDVLGETIGTFGTTSAVGEHLPNVTTNAAGFVNSAGSVSATSAVADAAGEELRVPAGDGSECAIPEIPQEVPVSALLSLIDVCSSSFSAVSAAGTPAALGSADAGQVALNGQALAELIFDLLLPTILEQLAQVTDPIQANVLDPVDAALEAVCDQLPPELNPVTVVDEAAAAGLPVDQVIMALPGGGDILANLDQECITALATQVDLVGVIVAVVEEAVREAILDALDQDLLTITVGSATSTILTEGDLTVARSEVEALTISTASLAFLLDVIDAIVADVVQGTIDEVIALVPESLDSVTSAIPSLPDVIDQVLAVIDLSALIDDSPLLEVSVARSVAEATAPLVEGVDAPVDTSGSSVGAAVVKFSPAIATFLGIPAETAIAPGVNQPIAEGTPLESSITIGSIEELTETVGAGNVATRGVRATGAQVALLTGIEELNGGIVVSAGQASARLGGTAPEAPATVIPSLPVTGSTDTLLLFGALGLAVAGLTARRKLSAS